MLPHYSSARLSDAWIPACSVPVITPALLSVFSFSAQAPDIAIILPEPETGHGANLHDFYITILRVPARPRLNNVNKTHLGSSLNFERANEQTKYISIII